MSKIFRLYKGGTATYEDWNNSPAFPYNSTSRDTIEDPDGASANHEITSIPSPFARIDLIKTAFKEVCKQDKKTKKVNLDGNTIFHKMVSDTLDVAEIFFNIDKYNGKIEVLKWDSSIMLDELNKSGISGHLYLSDALSKYMVSDSKTYNFGELKNIYLLNYVQGPDELNIIGSTSPATLFFSTANDLSYVTDIFFKEDKPFDSEYQPLYLRDFEFVKYFFALRYSIPNFAGLFPEVDEYLSKTFTEIKDQEKKNNLLNVSNILLENLSLISVVDIQQNDFVEVLGYMLYKKTRNSLTTTSDFTINTSKQLMNYPLILPIEAGNRYSDLKYVTGKWGNVNSAPYEDKEIDILKRILPFDGSINPYLTISDFLEDTIIRVPHTLNAENYFDGNLKLEEKELAYLLPIKPLLLEYFSPEEIMGSMSDGKQMLVMESLANNCGVKVTLRIPIKGTSKITYIEYNRLYYKSRSAVISNNEGGMTEFKFTGFVMPQVKFNNDNDAIYNITCVQSAAGKNEFLFFKGKDRVSAKSQTCRNDAQYIMIKADNYLLEKNNFDIVQVINNYGYKGVLLPIFRPQRNIDTFEFSIDLGTSNTHIEFRKAQEKPEVFTITNRDNQLCEMFVPLKNEYEYIEDLIEETELIEKDFIPSEIGKSDYYFPTRTVLSCAKNIDWTNVIDPFTMVNIPFTYDKRSELSYNNFKYNIKWGNGNDLRIIESYVRCLMLIIRNKVLLNNGDLQKTKITWLYPISMAPKRLRRLKATWDDAYNKYFGVGTTNCMTESAAPIQYFFKRYATTTDLVNIDIGGGTTDIAFAKDKNINYVTSFRFASNALFENSFSELDENNGIVDWYKNEIKQVLEEKKLVDLLHVFNSTNNAHPSNMASFLFSLKDNTIPKKAEVDPKYIDFNFILQEDENFKIVFIIFYTSIIYHIAQIVKSLGIDVPRHISFSGNGSKVVKVLTNDSKLLARFTKIIFEKVLEKPYSKELEFLGLDKDSNPKESTCKGGIIGSVSDDHNVKPIVFKCDCTGIVKPSDTYATITEDYKKNAIIEVDKFFKFVFQDMNSAFNFDNNFGVKASSVRIAQEVIKKDLDTFLEKGISLRREESEADDMIEETFFFYPIKGVLNAISSEIFNSLSNNRNI